MKLSLKILVIAIIAATTYSLVGCAAPAGYSYSNVTIGLSIGCTDCPAGITFNPAYPMPSVTNAGQNVSNGGGAGQSGVLPQGAVITIPAAGEGGTIEMVATVTNAPANVSWEIYPNPNLGGIKTLPTGTSTPVGESGSQVGSFNTPGSSTFTATGSTVYYSQNGVPVYSGAALEQAQAMGIPQGDVMIVLSVPNSPSNPASVTTWNQLVQIYNGSSSQGPPGTYLTPSEPTNPSGETQPQVTVARNTSYAFYGGVVGAAACLSPTNCTINGVVYPTYTTDNTAVWAVGPAPESTSTAVVGGNAVYGTITQSGVYTAPATIPTGSSVTSINGEVVVYVWSQLAPTIVSYAYIAVD